MRTCLGCGYDLAGLPDEHVCPECGLDYDGRAFAIELRPSSRLTELGWTGLIVAVVATLALAKQFSTAGFWAGVAAAWAALFGFHALISAAQRSGRSPNRRLVLNGSGLHLVSRGLNVVSLPWREVGRVHQSLFSGAFLVRSAADQKLIRIGYDRFGGWRHARRAVQAVREAKRIYECKDEA